MKKNYKKFKSDALKERKNLFKKFFLSLKNRVLQDLVLKSYDENLVQKIFIKQCTSDLNFL